MINCIAIDDEPLALEVVKRFAAKIPNLNLLGAYTDAVAAEKFLRHNPVDLLFIDIQMPDISGMQLVKTLQSPPLLIFTTAYREYAAEGFEVNAVDYLLKPFTYTRFQKAVSKAMDLKMLKQPLHNHEPCLLVYAGYKLVKIPYRDILYIEGMDDYAKIHTASDKYLTLLPLKSIMAKLPQEQFIRIHRSYIVPVQQIQSVQFRKLFLRNKKELPVGDTYRNEVKHLKRQ
jgi:two-component system, LytTR family, response regulator